MSGLFLLNNHTTFVQIVYPHEANWKILKSQASFRQIGFGYVKEKWNEILDNINMGQNWEAEFLEHFYHIFKALYIPGIGFYDWPLVIITFFIACIKTHIRNLMKEFVDMSYNS